MQSQVINKLLKARELLHLTYCSAGLGMCLRNMLIVLHMLVMLVEKLMWAGPASL